MHTKGKWVVAQKAETILCEIFLVLPQEWFCFIESSTLVNDNNTPILVHSLWQMDPTNIRC